MTRLAAPAPVPLLLVPLAVLAAACAPGGGERGATGTITVLAAASLTEAFGEIGRQFEAATGTRVTFSFDASSTLVAQVEAGAPADVLATADETTMGQAIDAGAAQDPVVFAHNRLTMLVAAGNPQRIGSLADMARPGLSVVLCTPEVPCGRFGAQVLVRAGVAVKPRSLEPNVKGVVAKVRLGEADAGIVYTTDARSAGPEVAAVDIPVDQNVLAAYPIATLRASPHPDLAAAFRDFVVSGAGRQVLGGSGFLP